VPGPELGRLRQGARRDSIKFQIGRLKAQMHPKSKSIAPQESTDFFWLGASVPFFDDPLPDRLIHHLRVLDFRPTLILLAFRVSRTLAERAVQ